MQSCRLRKEKQFSRLSSLLGILLATWHSAWLILTDAWHISYRRSKKFISWLQFLYIKSKSIEPNILPSEFYVLMCSICAIHVQYMCILSCRKHASQNMGKIQWSKFTVDINVETLFTLIELCSLMTVLNLALELNPHKSYINWEKENKSQPTLNSVFFMLKAFHSLFLPM